MYCTENSATINYFPKMFPSQNISSCTEKQSPKNVLFTRNIVVTLKYSITDILKKKMQLNFDHKNRVFTFQNCDQPLKIEHSVSEGKL